MINKCPDLRKVIFYFYKAFLSRIAKPTGFKNNEVKNEKEHYQIGQLFILCP